MVLYLFIEYLGSIAFKFRQKNTWVKVNDKLELHKLNKLLGFYFGSED